MKDMATKPIRVYADTSVFGGVFDAEFQVASQLFFEQVDMGRFHLITSAIVQAEMDDAPEGVRNFFARVISQAEIVDVTNDVLLLQQAYLNANIVTSKWATDALHVALATIYRCSLIVSWNFKHIVHFEKIPRYNAVNVLNGYTTLAIHSPQEVLSYEEDI